MHQVLYVALGGAIGASLRFWIASMGNAQSSGFIPVGTLSVNLIGSFLIGWLFGLFSMQTEVSLRLQLFLITGLLGGFTTFSAFSLESWQLIEEGHYKAFAIYFLASNLGGIALAYTGFRASGSTITI